MDINKLAEQSPAKLAIPIVVIGLMSSIVGGYIKDRLAMENTTSSSTVRLERMERALEQHLGNSVPADGYRRDIDTIHESMKGYVGRQELEVFERSLDVRLDDLKSDLRDIKERLNKRQ